MRKTPSGKKRTTAKITASREIWCGSGQKTVAIAVAKIERPKTMPRDRTGL
jgi:hypothetical protein